jgi:hypothetical protein
MYHINAYVLSSIIFSKIALINLGHVLGKGNLAK